MEVLAGRVALALDSAGLFTELQTMESQRTAALGNLAEAVTVQNPQGTLIYANLARIEQALADLQVAPQADDTTVLAVQRVGMPSATTLESGADAGLTSVP